MAIYINGLVVKICPAFEADPGVIHHGTIPMADAIVVLIPGRDFVIRQESVMVLGSCLGLAR